MLLQKVLAWKNTQHVKQRGTRNARHISSKFTATGERYIDIRVSARESSNGNMEVCLMYGLAHPHEERLVPYILSYSTVTSQSHMGLISVRLLACPSLLFPCVNHGNVWIGLIDTFLLTLSIRSSIRCIGKRQGDHSDTHKLMQFDFLPWKKQNNFLTPFKPSPKHKWSNHSLVTASMHFLNVLQRHALVTSKTRIWKQITADEIVQQQFSYQPMMNGSQ